MMTPMAEGLMAGGPFSTVGNRKSAASAATAMTSTGGYYPSSHASQLPTQQQQHHRLTDIPVLDDLFSELNSDLAFDCNFSQNFGGANGNVAQSEPVDFADMERILLSHTRKPISNCVFLCLTCLFTCLFSCFQHSLLLLLQSDNHFLRD